MRQISRLSVTASGAGDLICVKHNDRRGNCSAARREGRAGVIASISDNDGAPRQFLREENAEGACYRNVPEHGD